MVQPHSGSLWCVQGAVQEKERAAEVYEDALASGQKAFLFERKDEYSYTVNIGRLDVDERVLSPLLMSPYLQFALSSDDLCPGVGCCRSTSHCRSFVNLSPMQPQRPCLL